METKVNYTVVGVVVIIFTVLFFTFTIWLSVGLEDIHYDKYAVYMNESVAGLAEKSSVKYNGVDVGFVASIELQQKDPSQVFLLLKVRQGTPITVETHAQLRSQGLTGIDYLEL